LRWRSAGTSALQALSPAVKLARRRVAVGRRQVPLGAAFGALFALPVIIALGVATLSSGPGGAAEEAGTAAAVVVDEDLSELMQRAASGNPAALSELVPRAAEAKQAAPYEALARGYFKLGQLGAGLDAYRSGGKLDPKLGESTEVMTNLRRGLADGPSQALSLEVAATLGAAGADFLYDVYDANRSLNAPLAKQAKALLDSEPVAAAHSPALKLLLELPKAKTEGCGAVKKLLPRVQQNGDARLVPALTRMNDRRGCGFLGLRDCFTCLRANKGKELAAALKAASERPAPRVGS
jgi:hypothetical protein